MQFLKKHYEKIILCVVLLGLAFAAILMEKRISALNEQVSQPVSEAPRKGKSLAPLDLSNDMLALAQVTNPPPVVLSGEHNLFNPVTWKRKSNGELLKILSTGPDALAILNISPLYTIISYEHSSGAGIYVFTVQTNSRSRTTDHPRIGEKPKSGLYIVRGIEGAPDEPSRLRLEIPQTGETNVWISKTVPYKRVDGYTVDMQYPPESRNLPKEHVNELITLDNEQYKIVEITNNAVRVQAIKNTKVTTIPWSGSAETNAPASMTLK
jgi:hypothetical protein